MVSVLSTYSKAGLATVAVNFAPSGSAGCDKRCRFHPDKNGGCYAAKLEAFRKQLREKLERHESLGPAAIVEAALLELRQRLAMGGRVDFLRFCSFGPFPRPSDCSEEFIEGLRALLVFCNQQGIAVHFPVESSTKAKFYGEAVGDLVTVRQTVMTLPTFNIKRSPCAFTAGERGKSKAENIKQAKRAAEKHRTQTGRKTVVCPAESSDSPRAKCGLCDACAKPHIDVVYVLH